MNWFSEFIQGVVELPSVVWILLGLLFALGVVMILFAKKKLGKPVTLCLVGLIFVGFVVAVILMGQPAELDGAAPSILYSPIFWGTIAAIIGVLGLILCLSGKQFTPRMLSAGALSVAVAFLLSCLVLYRMPQGGTITPGSMLPIMVFSMAYGPTAGVAAGTIYGVLQLVQGAYVVHPIQLLLDYVLPFAVLGIAGFFKKEKLMPLGAALAGLCRFLVHFISGFVFFYMYAPEGQSVFMYNLIYNGSYMLPETVICVVLLLIPQVRRAMLQIIGGAEKSLRQGA